MRVNLRGGFVTLARMRAGDGRARAAGRDRRRHERLGLPHRPVDGALLGVEGRARRARAGRRARARTARHPGQRRRARHHRHADVRGDRPHARATASGSRAGPRSAGSARPPRSRRPSSRCARSTGSPARSSRPTAASRWPARSTRWTRTPTEALVSDPEIRARSSSTSTGSSLDTEVPVYAAWCAVFEAHGARAADDRGVVGRDRDRPTTSTSRRGSSSVPTARSTSTRCTSPGARTATRCSTREQVRPGVEAWLDEADAAGLGLAIASSSPADWVDRAPRPARAPRPVRPRRDRRRRAPRQARARHLPRGVRAARRRAGHALARRGLAERHRGREGGRAAVRHGAQRAHRAARPLGRRPAPRVARRLHARRGDRPPRAHARASSDRPRARCPATGRATTPSRPGRTPTRSTAARRRGRAGPACEAVTFQVVGANW